MSYKLKIKTEVSLPSAINNVSEVIDLILKRLPLLELSDLKIDRYMSGFDSSNPYNCKLYNSLKRALPKDSDIRYGEISHDPGMGGSYGEGYTIYLPDDIAPAIYTCPYSDDEPCAYISVDSFIDTALAPDETFQSALDTHLGLDDDNDIESFIAHIGYHVATHDNTYNNEHDLDGELNYLIATKEEGDDYIYPSDNVLIIVQRHRGGDVRCNYSSPEVYSYNDDSSECAFFDRSVGWSFISATDETGRELSRDEFQAIDESYQVGYSSNPSYQLSKDIETCERLDDGSGYRITLKSGVSGVIVPINYNY